ncbi:MULTISPECIES: hypothetical protein [unclassified Bradyrhizobium]|uniref:hypothetical protein n=1 Tax=unclassified Bradyrhizobium TaxID=2631580 RepID=UPI00247A4484|nr:MULTISPECIES: hypothetical protein [unclassified Bradyrhizobium]WGR95838.1 hypothetical protein MTX20_19460 [Bradyrhizobium sp. ISRA435]WGS00966.1 hypothetical protein MTX23_09150 [Bradyrhizobium sp. ISRA436]WGS07853.1 hypothetical protein MTX18_09155 [Bradyrhizobium sp. ISRA437]WGS14741.1 hypothetical protein MTX26_09155 [Bradyrhizobium sp. ISRA443]WGS22352.1 hypothetical protein MTX22_12200 [Bradyrhizobium sp. ISRA463]
MFKALIAGAVAIGLAVAPAAAGAMTMQHKTHKVHHAKKMTPGTTTGMSSGKSSGTATQKPSGTANQKTNGGGTTKQGY